MAEQHDRPCRTSPARSGHLGRLAAIAALAVSLVVLPGLAPASADGLRAFFHQSTATSRVGGDAIGQGGGFVRVDALLRDGLGCYDAAGIDKRYANSTRIDALVGADLTVYLERGECRTWQPNRVIFQVSHPMYTDILNITFVADGREVDYQRVQIVQRAMRNSY